MESVFLVAKYVPDLVRREPRNVGIMLYDEGEWVAKFVGESEAGELDRRRLRQFQSPETYVEWWNYWRGAMAQGTWDRESGKRVRPDDPSFARSLCNVSGDNYLLEYGSPMLIPSDIGGRDSILAHLFGRLVQFQEPPQEEDENWHRRMQSVMHEYKLDKSRHFHRPYELKIPVGEMTQVLVFPYAYVNGQHRLYKRMPIAGQSWRAEAVQRAVNDVLWSFSNAKDVCDDFSGVALMYTTADERKSGLADDARKLAKQQAECVVDLDIEEEVDAEFAQLAG